MKTAMKKIVTGILSIGEVMFKNQFGLMGKNLRNSRKKNKLLRFSSTWKKVKIRKVINEIEYIVLSDFLEDKMTRCTFFCSMATLSGNSLTMCSLPNAWDRRKQRVAPTVVRTQARRRPYHVPNKAPAKMFWGG